MTEEHKIQTVLIKRFVYLVMRQPKDSVYLFSRHTNDECPTSIFAIYDNMKAALFCLNKLYENNQGKYEYVIIKKVNKTTAYGQSKVSNNE